jgi:hypothetical protein
MARTPKQFLTPDFGGDVVCRPLFVPSEYLPYINYVLQLLTFEQNWEQLGAVTPADAAATMAAMFETYLIGDCMPTPTPEFAMFLSDAREIVAGNNLAYNLGSTYFLNGAQYQSPPAQNDKTKIRVQLGEGLYSIRMLGTTRANAGIVHVLIDDVDVGTIDWYSATTLTNTIKTLNNVPFNGDLQHEVAFLVSTKNASSSGYQFEVQWIRFTRTAD